MAVKAGNKSGARDVVELACPRCGEMMRLIFKMIARKNDVSFKSRPQVWWNCNKCGHQQKKVKRDHLQ